MGKLFQASTLMSLMDGNFDYTISIEYFLKNGDTGIGSYNGLNGEAIFLDGIAYNATGSGNIKIMDIPQTGVTFGQITKFNENVNLTPLKIDRFTDFDDLSKQLTSNMLFKGPNYFYMIKGSGTFSSITVRTSFKQRKPYRKMELVSKELKFYTYKDIKGTIIGVYSPSYTNGLSFDGWHFHFLSEDKAKGGHVTAIAGSLDAFKINMMDKYEIKLSSSHIFQYGNTDADNNTNLENSTPKEAEVKEEK